MTQKEHKTDPKGLPFGHLQRFRELTEIAEGASTLMDHNRSRDWQQDAEKCQKLLTWTVIERNKIVDELIAQIFSRGEVVK